MKWGLIIACLLQVVSARAQNTFISFGQKIAAAAGALNCEEPDEQHPVTLNAEIIDATGSDSVAVIIKARMAPGWHIYAYVPQTMPYIVSEFIIKPSPNIKLVGDWEKSRPIATAMDKGVLIYEKEAVFIHKLVKVSGSETGTITAGLYYQTCNLRQCLPPIEKTFELKY